jgi:hypothetical protein
VNRLSCSRRREEGLAVVTIESKNRPTPQSNSLVHEQLRPLGGLNFMPRYFFDFTDGEFIGWDQFGTKLPDVETAAREAVAALANISKDVRKRHRDRVLALNVRGQNGQTVLNVSLTLAAKWFPDDQIECNQTELVGSIDLAMPSREENALTPLAP